MKPFNGDGYPRWVLCYSFAPCQSLSLRRPGYSASGAWDVEANKICAQVVELVSIGRLEPLPLSMSGSLPFSKQISQPITFISKIGPEVGPYSPIICRGLFPREFVNRVDGIGHTGIKSKGLHISTVSCDQI